MPTFVYKVKISPKEIIQGRIQADDQAQAVNALTSQGYFPLSVDAEQTAALSSLAVFSRISGRELYLFSHQLAVMLKSGLDMLASLRVIVGQIRNKRFKNLINEVAAQVKNGQALSQALAVYPQVFGSFYLAMLRCAESGGNLEQTLEQLAEYIAKEDELKSTVKQAFIYPAFVAGVGLVTVAVLIGFVVPRLSSMFSDFNRSLPLATKILLRLAGFLRVYWPAVAGGLAAMAAAALSFVRNPGVRYFLDCWALKLPVVSDITVKINIRHFCRSLSALLSAGIPIVSALETAQGTVTNRRIQNEIKKIAGNINQGESLRASLAKLPYFPPLVASIISVGEASGNLEVALMRVSQEYETDIDRRIKTFTKLLEPLLILIMGLIVGFVVISIMLPMFQMDLMAK